MLVLSVDLGPNQDSYWPHGAPFARAKILHGPVSRIFFLLKRHLAQVAWSLRWSSLQDAISFSDCLGCVSSTQFWHAPVGI